ncbi:DUF2268 domain-containing protein [bacterium LRH843]|nr:DUF2268 domain-containing protein [bacterium LRH843]
MGVIRTDKWLRIYCEKWSETTSMSEKVNLQRKVLIKPLCDVFEMKDIHLQSYLLSAGLCSPDVNVDLQKWVKHQFWQEVQNQFSYLRKKWKGPDVDIYLLPLERRNSFIFKHLGGKMGITIRGAIILFIHSDLNLEDLRALFTHEYHHIFRLMHTNQSEKSIPLLESMMMEGLAELAVKEEIGSEWNASWTKYYDQKWNKKWFEKWIRPNLYLKGRKSHQSFLYGASGTGIPLWLGYYTGYRIAESAAKEVDTTCSLVTLTTEQLFERSSFPEKEKK